MHLQLFREVVNANMHIYFIYPSVGGGDFGDTYYLSTIGG